MSVEAIFNAVVNLEKKNVPLLVQAEIERGTSVQAILNQGLIGALDEVGKRFSAGIMFVPEMLMAAKCMQGGLDVLRPLLKAAESISKGNIVIGTVKGDLHDIGKNIVAIMLDGAGFNVTDVGVDVEVQTFLDKAREAKADILALSALLTTTMSAMEATVAAFKKELPSVKVIVGGAPVNERFAQKIAADGFAGDAPGAVRKCRALMG